jgi:colanic acid biosynthesis glycosyl transferase WcaI
MFLYRRATAIVAVTESFRRELLARGVDGEKIHVVVNGVDATQYQPRPRSAALEADLGLQSKFVAGYLGTHGLAHALEKVVEAAALLSQREDIVFLFVGGGADRARLEAIVAGRKLENVVMLARQPKERMAEIWSLCDVALIPLRDAPVFKTVIPSKIFECMGMGIPILMSLPEGEATNIVRTMECGVCVPPENPAAMAAAIERLAGSPVDRQRLAAAARAAAPLYSRDALAASMLGVLEAQRGNAG